MKKYLPVKLFAFACIIFASNSHAVDYKKMIGEWSKQGECNISRNVFLEGGKYQVVERKRNGTWAVEYKGIYIPQKITHESPKGAVGEVVVADGPSQGGNLLIFEVISNNRLKGYWQENDELSFEKPKDALFDYVRCGTRK